MRCGALRWLEKEARATYVRYTGWHIKRSYGYGRFGPKAGWDGMTGCFAPKLSTECCCKEAFHGARYEYDMIITSTVA